MGFGDNIELQQYSNASHTALSPLKKDKLNPGMTALPCAAWTVSLIMPIVIQPAPGFIIISAKTTDQMVLGEKVAH